VVFSKSMPDVPPQKSQTSLQGYLLLAHPGLRDGTFDRSVILLVDHQPEQGAYGIILNQPSGKTVGDYLSDPAFARIARIPVHIGGPVARQQLTFCALWWNQDRELRFATRISAEDAIKHSRNPGTLVRAFVGYAGWGEGQLETEMRSDSWITTLPRRDLLAFVHDWSLWSETMQTISPLHQVLAEVPDCPSKN
jgi:putative transcriptional regulator